jgi:hypothetical protein
MLSDFAHEITTALRKSPCSGSLNNFVFSGGNGSENGAADQPSEDPDPMDGQITVYAESPVSTKYWS